MQSETSREHIVECHTDAYKIMWVMKNLYPSASYF